VFLVRYELNLFVMKKKVDRIFGLVVRVPSYRTEMYCASCEVQTEFICYVEESRPPLWSSGQSSWFGSPALERFAKMNRHFAVFIRTE
jgi:hypothetical protein